MATINCTTYESQEFLNYSILRTVAGAVNMILSATAILFIVALKRHLFYLQRIALYFCIGSLLQGLAAATNKVDYDHRNSATAKYCICAGLATHYALWVTLMAACVLIFSIMVKVIYGKEHVRLERLWVFLVFGSPLLHVWIPFIKSSYGRSEFLCWIRDLNDDCSKYTTGVLMQIILWRTPLYLVLISFFVAYVFMCFRLIRRRHWGDMHSHDAEMIKETKKELLFLTLCPITYIAFNIPNYTVSIYNTVNQGPFAPSAALYMYAFLTQIAPGTIALLYTVNFRLISYRELVRAFKGFNRKNTIHRYPLITTVEPEKSTGHRKYHSTLHSESYSKERSTVVFYTSHESNCHIGSPS